MGCHSQRVTSIYFDAQNILKRIRSLTIMMLFTRKQAIFLQICFLIGVMSGTLLPQKYYVDITADCGFKCDGERAQTPLPNLRRAFKSIQQASSSRPPFSNIDFEVLVGPGSYSGGANTELTLNARSVSMTSTHGSSRTIIDCLGEGRFLTITNASVSLSGFTIRNCYSTGKGGSLLSISSSLFLEDIIMGNNTAYEGGAIYASRSSLTLTSSRIQDNKASNNGGALYLSRTQLTARNSILSCNNIQAANDIFCQNSNGTFDFASSTSKAGFSCAQVNSTCSFTYDGTTQLCGQNSTCSRRPPLPSEDPNTGAVVDPDADQLPISEIENYATCGDNRCDVQFESCLTCPDDCRTCSFTGVKLQSYVCSPDEIGTDESCLYRVTSRPSSETQNFLYGVPAPVTGIMTGYFAVPKSGRYFFEVQGSNVGAKLMVDNNLVIGPLLVTATLSSTVSLGVDASTSHSFSLMFYSTSNEVRSVKLRVWQEQGAEIKPFQSLNVCGDGILDPLEESGQEYNCTADVTLSQETQARNISCGNGICQESIYERCFVDCFSSITKTCSPLAVKYGHLSAGITANTGEALDNLVNNLQLWNLPGGDHLANGFDIIKGEEKVQPIFYLSFCETNVTNMVQDSYRSKVYMVAQEMSAQPYPFCSFDLSTVTYSSAREMANSLSESTSLSFEIQADGGIPLLFNIEAGAAYSQDMSVQTAMEMETKRTGSILKTEVYCLTSKVQMNKITFHPAFLKDLSLVDSVEEMLPLVKKYGTHYYRSASLGGKLTQITTVESEFTRSKTSSELSQHAQLSFHASVSSPVFSVKGSFDYSKDTDLTSEQQDSFESSSSRSKILTYGGAPGSFGPSSSFDTPTSYGEWAATIDLLPVPVQYELDFIINIIPELWKSKSGHSIKNLWFEAQKQYFNEFSALLPRRSIIGSLNCYYDVIMELKNLPAEDPTFPAYVGGRADTHLTLEDNPFLAMEQSFYHLSNASHHSAMMLVDQEGPKGSYFPFKWDIGSGIHVIQSPLQFSLIGECVSNITEAQLVVTGGTPSHFNLDTQIGGAYVVDLRESLLYQTVGRDPRPVDLSRRYTLQFKPTIQDLSAQGKFSIQFQLIGDKGTFDLWYSFDVAESKLKPTSENSTLTAADSRIIQGTLPYTDGNSELGELKYIRVKMGNSHREDIVTARFTLFDAWIALPYCSTSCTAARLFKATEAVVLPIPSSTYTVVPVLSLDKFI